MSNIPDRPKVAAKCTACSKIHTAWQLEDGSLQLIGQGGRCVCGEADFYPISVTDG